jgi:hypothetical protein
MRKLLAVAGTICTLAFAGAAHAVNTTTVSDPPNDFLASFVGNHDPDLDVTSFGVSFDQATMNFTLSATLAGAINPALPGLYVIGINTGTGVNAPFGGIGEPNVIFNQVAVIQKTGATTIGANNLTATIAGNAFTLVVPLSLLPTTGFTPDNYGFNLWPRNGLGNNNQIADFAPENSTLSAVPEPAAWAMMLAGFGLLGGVLRRKRTVKTAANPA